MTRIERRRLTSSLGVAVAVSCAAVLAANAGAGEDPRDVLHVDAGQREELRAGMRAYLESVQGIVDGMASSRAAVIVDSARRSGEGMLTLHSAVTAVALPAGFIALGLDTHRKFDALAALAAGGAPRLQVLGALNDILANCTSCHAAYRIAP